MGIVSAQDRKDSTISPLPDSISRVDTISKRKMQTQMSMQDSVSRKPEKHQVWFFNPGNHSFTYEFNREVLQRHPYFGFSAVPLNMISEKKEFQGKEALFYLLIFLFFYFAVLKNLFPKYFNDLFRLFFRTTLKQKQIREQLMQTPLPSLLFNGLFVAVSALYVDFLLQHFKLKPVDSFWLLFFYSSFGLSGIYLVKFLGLKLSGWVFNMQDAADDYIFIVFIVNKMIGIFLLPFLVLLAFTEGYIYEGSLVLSWFGVVVLFVYRFILSFSAVRNQIKVNPFHFFLYLCAFEIAPLLLIYKGLLYFLQ